MEKIIFILSAFLFLSCEKEEVTPQRIAAVQEGLITLTVRQKAGASDSLFMEYSVNGVRMVKKSKGTEIKLDTVLAQGDIVNLDCKIKNKLGQFTSGYRYTKIMQNGLIGAGLICSSTAPSCSPFVTYTVK